MKRLFLAFVLLGVVLSVLSGCGYSRKRTGCPMQASVQVKVLQTPA